MKLDAASAIAASKCYLARTMLHGVRVRVSHPRECGWCIYPTAELVKAVEAFWGRGWEEAARFERLPREVQRRLVLEAQAFEPLP